MRATLGWKKISITVGEVVSATADAIVSCANRRLMPENGLDAALHKAAGPPVQKELKQKYPTGCAVGSAVLTHAGFLQSQFVIHAVGPQWFDGKHNEAELLRATYLKSLELASEMSCVSIAFPAISVGTYKYPIADAAKIALLAVRDYDFPNQLPSDIQFFLHTTELLKAFEQAMKQIHEYEIEI